MRLPYLWLRIGNRRLGIMPDDGFAPLFSERYGYSKVWRVLGYKIKWDTWHPMSVTFRAGLTKRYASPLKSNQQGDAP